MSELRWNPLLKEWVITATHRQKRTFKPPENYCPLCPTRGEYPTEVPDKNYDLVVFENRFPSLKLPPPPPEVTGTSLYEVKPSAGVCEVVLYTPDHHGHLSQKPLQQVEKLIRVWQDRYLELGQKKEIEYVFIFENRGEEVGVTLHHPHGQIYGDPFIPPAIKKQLDASSEHLNQNGECLFCRILKEEAEDGRRIVASNDSFVAFIPFFARYPYEVHIYSRQHIPSLAELDETNIKHLAGIYHQILQKYDNLFGFPFPFIMSIMQKPTKSGKGENYSHLNIQFYPPYRSKDKLKYLGGSESAAGTFINDTRPEEKAKELRDTPPGGNS